MTIKQYFTLPVILFILSLGLFACKESTPHEKEQPTTTQLNNLNIHIPNDPEHLNPLIATSISAHNVDKHIFSRLLSFDPKDLKLRAELATQRPVITEINSGEFNGGMSISYEIRPEAKWDNGKDITAEDYLFTVKAIKNLHVNSGSLRPYFDFIHQIKIDAENPKKFTIYSKEHYLMAEEASGEQLMLLPEHIFDAEGIMRQYTLEQLNGKTPESIQALSNDENLKLFAESFNSVQYDRDPKFLIGSGPYRLVQWSNKQHLILERKKDWWGDKVDGNTLLKAYPEKIIYKIISDYDVAILQAKEQSIDILTGIPNEKFSDLQENEQFTNQFDIEQPKQLTHYYIGFNGKKNKLADKRVRKAIAHITDRADIINAVCNGLAVPVSSPIHPDKPYYNKSLQDIEFSLDKAQALLKEAGWIDTDNNGILDKVINGQKEELSLSYRYTTGHTIRKSIGLILQDQAERIGIKINLVPLELATLLDDAKQRNFDLISMAWVATSPGLDDLKQVWHSSSQTTDGSNRLNFGDAQSDAIIDELRVCLDSTKRVELYHQIQTIIHEEQPCVFLFVPTERMAISKRFEHVGSSSLNPGYAPHQFKLKAN